MGECRFQGWLSRIVNGLIIKIITRKDLAQRNFLLRYFHFQPREYVRMNACLLLDCTIPYKHFNESANLLLEHKVALVVENISHISCYYVIEGVVLLLDLFEQAGNETLVLIQLKILAVQLHTLTIGATVLQVTLYLALHELTFQ